MGAIKARVAAGGLLLLLVWQAGVAAASEGERLSLPRTVAALTASAAQRLRDTVGPHEPLLVAVWTHAPDARHLFVVRDPEDVAVRPPGPTDEVIDRTVPKDMLMARLTTLLFPVVVRELPGTGAHATRLAGLLEPTTYVLDLRSERDLAELPGLRPLARGDGFELLGPAASRAR